MRMYSYCVMICCVIFTMNKPAHYSIRDPIHKRCCKHQEETWIDSNFRKQRNFLFGCKQFSSSGLPMAESQVPVGAAMCHAGPGPGPLL